MRIWIVTYTELGGATGILYDRDEAGQDRDLVFAESAYAQAVQAFNQMRDERLSFHFVQVLGQYGPDAHAYLVAYDGDDEVALRPYDVIGG